MSWCVSCKEDSLRRTPKESSQGTKAMHSYVGKKHLKLQNCVTHGLAVETREGCSPAQGIASDIEYV